MGPEEAHPPLFGVCATGGAVKMCQNLVELSGRSGWETGASLHSCTTVVANTNRFETPPEETRSVSQYTTLNQDYLVCSTISFIYLKNFKEI